MMRDLLNFFLSQGKSLPTFTCTAEQILCLCCDSKIQCPSLLPAIMFLSRAQQQQLSAEACTILAKNQRDGFLAGLDIPEMHCLTAFWRSCYDSKPAKVWACRIIQKLQTVSLTPCGWSQNWGLNITAIAISGFRGTKKGFCLLQWDW